MLITVNYINTVNALPAPSTDAEIEHNRLSDASMFQRLGIGSNHFLINRQYNDDDNVDEDEIVHQKRELIKKWAKFHQGAQSPYTIAFPALIRTRRWIE
jgi:hypothetical protein